MKAEMVQIWREGLLKIRDKKYVIQSEAKNLDDIHALCYRDPSLPLRMT